MKLENTYVKRGQKTRQVTERSMPVEKVIKKDIRKVPAETTEDVENPAVKK